MPPTSTKHVEPAETTEPRDPREGAVERARRRLRQRHYDRPDVRRLLAALILRRAARRSL
ncbi:MAG: hypothetical protein ACM3JJ_13845 [Hyphomicrobiales bacterium]